MSWRWAALSISAPFAGMAVAVGCAFSSQVATLMAAGQLNDVELAYSVAFAPFILLAVMIAGGWIWAYSALSRPKFGSEASVRLQAWCPALLFVFGIAAFGLWTVSS